MPSFHALPYSGRLEGENFREFQGFVAISRKFSQNLGTWDYLATPASISQSISHKKFPPICESLPYKSFLLYGILQGFYSPTCYTAQCLGSYLEIFLNFYNNSFLTQPNNSTFQQSIYGTGITSASFVQPFSRYLHFVCCCTSLFSSVWSLLLPNNQWHFTWNHGLPNASADFQCMLSYFPVTCVHICITYVYTPKL